MNVVTIDNRAAAKLSTRVHYCPICDLRAVACPSSLLKMSQKWYLLASFFPRKT
jgi:hypothetical protein